MAASLSKSAMGSCINGHINQNDTVMMDSKPVQEKVAILDAGAQYGKVSIKIYLENILVKLLLVYQK